MLVFNSDCITQNYLPDASVDLLICDPPFGIDETTFHKHYKRDESYVINGYVEAPSDYYQFSLDWLTQAKRVMKKDATLYIISGWTNLRHILNAVEKTGFSTINHLIWKFNFGVATKNKYVSSHYHILYVTTGKPKFNTYCRFGSQEKALGKSLLYQDLEDVFVINKEYMPGSVKNKNKLPDALVEKLVLYSSSVGDVVGDFFLGSFTTAFVAKKLGRIPVGFEVNPESFNHYLAELDALELGSGLDSLKKVVNTIPVNQGKRISIAEREAILTDYQTGIGTKKEIIAYLCDKYGRGRFAIKNILDESLNSDNADHNNIGTSI